MNSKLYLSDMGVWPLEQTGRAHIIPRLSRLYPAPRSFRLEAQDIALSRL